MRKKSIYFNVIIIFEKKLARGIGAQEGNYTLNIKKKKSVKIIL
jgi:hypothetical protein